MELYGERKPYVKYYRSNRVALVAQRIGNFSDEYNFYIVFEPTFATLDDIFDKNKNKYCIFVDLENLTLEEADKFANSFRLYDGYRESCLELGLVALGLFKVEYFLDTKEFIALYYMKRNKAGEMVEYLLSDNLNYLTTHNVDDIFKGFKSELKGLEFDDMEKEEFLFLMKRLKEIGIER